MNLATLVDEYLTEVGRVNQPATEVKYGQLLSFLIRDCGDKTPIDAITEQDILQCLARWKNSAKATQALSVTVFRGVFRHAVKKKYLAVSPAAEIERPRLPKPEDREVVIVSTNDVKRMFAACQSWGDEICLGILAYTGARRRAVSALRWRDVDLQADPPHAPYGWIRHREKGGKVVDKPIPVLLREIIDRAPEHVDGDYLVPNYRPWQVERTERQNSIIYRRVKNIAARAGVQAHVHAIRAAFAVFFLEHHRGSIKSLQMLLGHENLETTRHYTRGLDRKVLLSEVVDMDWGSSLADRVMEDVESALSGVPAEGGYLPQAPSPGQPLSEGRGAPLSALSEGGERCESVRGDRGDPATLSESALGHEEGHEPVAAHHTLPRGPEKAHTGFEPVPPFWAWLYAPLTRTRHYPGHRIGHYPTV